MRQVRVLPPQLCVTTTYEPLQWVGSSVSLSLREGNHERSVRFRPRRTITIYEHVSANLPPALSACRPYCRGRSTSGAPHRWRCGGPRPAVPAPPPPPATP